MRNGRGRLWERDQAVNELLGAVEEMRAGTGSLVLVTGEAGIGKTSVVCQVLGRIGREIRVLRGACDDMLAPPPLQPLRDAARGTGGPLEHALAQDDSDLLYEAIVAELGTPEPTVLLIEDVHWADDSTLDLLRYLARRLQRVNAVLVLTYRANEIDPRHPLRALLGALTDVPVRRIALEPLSVDAVNAIARDSGRDGGDLFRLTGGNPFYLTEALAGPADAVPATVVDATLARLHTLDPESVSVVEQLSVIPTPVGLHQIGPLLGDRLDAVTRAEQRGVLETDDSGVRFRHELARQAIEQSLPAIRRRALNAAIVRLLLGCDVDRELSALVHHAVKAGEVATLAKYAPRAAARATKAGSHRQALTHYEAVIPYADQLPAGDRAKVLAGYAWELHIAHRFPEAVERCRAAVVLFEELADQGPLAEALLQLSRHCYLAGETGAALKAVGRALEVAQGNDEVWPAAVGCHAMMLVLTGSPGAALPALEEARRLAERAGKTDLVALCLNYLGLARCDLDQPGGLQSLRDSVGTALATGDYEAVARGYTNLVEMLYRAGRWDELEETIAAGLEFTRERGFGSHIYNLETHRALLMMRRGELSQAAKHLRELIDTVDEAGMLTVLSTSSLGRVLARLGDSAAEQLLADAWELARRQQSVLGLGYAATAYVEWAWLNGRPDLARAVGAEFDKAGVGVPVLETPAYRELGRYLALAGGFGAADGWEETPYERALGLATTDQREPMLEALQILLNLGAAPAASRIRRRLTELGVARIPRGAHASSRSNPAGLTDRQLDVLVHLVEGCTNAEIAEKLVVSVRTVDHHVSAILSRLDARSRREAARIGKTLDLTAVPRRQPA
ncbi:AAA family ATPase [Kribbella sp. NPDC056861]|uniref:ATP-binding protein n=1 Tax=Kribbella sp. NPDC056861 TaxID=3154857 RepID=UPI00341A7E59